MQKNSSFLYIFLFISLLSSSYSYGQQPVQQQDPELTWERAIDLWNKEKYSAAQKHFIEAAQLYKNENNPRLTDCHFYAAYCALKLYNKDAEFRFRRFLELHPEDPRDNLSYFLLGKYNFERKKYPKTLDWFSNIKVNRLADKNIPDYYYYKAFSLFKTGEYEKAKLNFAKNLTTDNPYYHPAVYYTAYIDYSYENYQSALEGFQLIADEDGFSELVPYYVAQIFFIQKRYKELIEYAEPWISKVSTKRKGEMSRLLAEAYYHEENYSKALEYFPNYFDSPVGINRDDYYAYGYCLYKTEDYSNALIQFNRVINEKDALTQITLLNMGDSYLKIEKFKHAQNAFKNASQFDYDPIIKEEAFFNYAKLSYQLSFDPFDEAIQAFEKYLDTYPHSDKKDEAYNFLLTVYMKTRNYKSALDVIEKINAPDKKVKMAYQIAVYNIAVEYYQKKNYDEALRWFQFVAKYDFEKVTLAESYFWQGELKFKKKNYRGAIESYRQFLAASDSFKSNYYSRAYYGQAYAQLKLKAFTKASENYHQFIHFDKGINKKLNADAEQRIGDIYFLQKNYSMSISYFKSALDKSDFDKDYALFQIAMSEGYLENSEDKIFALNRLIDELPESVYRPQAIYEKGNSYFENENYPIALETFENLEKRYPDSKFIADSYLKKGLIYIKMHDEEASKNAFLYVFNNYPNSQASTEALISLKEVDMATFTRLAKETGYADISEEDVDAANFEDAEDKYLQGKYERSSFLFQHYLEGFPNGRFRQNAHFYKADCHVRLEQIDSALIQFELLLEQTGNPYYENALYMASSLSLKVNALEKAYTYYQLLYYSSENKQYHLEALGYLIEETYRRTEYLKVLSYADEVRNGDKWSDEKKQRALLLQIKSHLQLDEKTKAISLINEVDFDLIDENTAELAYLKSEWLYQEAKFKESEEAIYFLLQNFGAFGEWRARAFILLGDVYLGLEDPFQAKATWQSVIDHHKGEELVSIAQQKLDQLIAAEEEENNVEEEELEVDYTIDNKQLIEETSDTLLDPQVEILGTDSIERNDK
jgi:tetratricopeptide (TPR) repeat protein